jgi:hypothetical protein
MEPPESQIIDNLQKVFGAYLFVPSTHVAGNPQCKREEVARSMGPGHLFTVDPA